MRTIFLTGPGGAGTSSAAAGLAQRFAAEGQRTLILREHRPGDPGHPPTTEAGPVSQVVRPLQWGTDLWDSLAPIRALIGAPVQGLDGTTVLALPPLRELAWWEALRSAWQGQWDAVVVDAGPLDDAVRLLTMPDLVVGLLRRTWPLADRTGDAADRLMSGSWHLRAMARLDSEAAELADRLRASSTSIHLVSQPSEHQLRRTLHTMTPLALFEFAVTDLVLNRVDRARAYDQAVLQRLPGQLPGLTVRTADALAVPPTAEAFGQQVYPDLTPSARPVRPRVGRSGETFVWSWPLPFAQPDSVAAQVADEDLLLTIDDQRRIVPLPSVLRRCQLREASFTGSTLRLSFVPDPALWPRKQEAS